MTAYIAELLVVTVGVTVSRSSVMGMNAPVLSASPGGTVQETDAAQEILSRMNATIKGTAWLWWVKIIPDIFVDTVCWTGTF